MSEMECMCCGEEDDIGVWWKELKLIEKKKFYKEMLVYLVCWVYIVFVFLFVVN